MAEIPDLTPTHRVGLTGQGEWPAARPANGAGGQMQVADGVGVPRAVGALVQPHGPQAHPIFCRTDPAGGLAYILLCQPGDFCHVRGRKIRQESGHLGPTFGMRGDERFVDVAVLEQQVQNPVEQSEIGTGLELQEQIGLFRRGCAAWVGNDELCTALDPVEQAKEKNRVTVCHIGAGDEEQVCGFEILV